MCATACGTTKVVFVDTQADLVRLGPDVRGTVYVNRGGEWIKSKKLVNKYPKPDSYYYSMGGKYPVNGGTCMPHFGFTDK